MNRSQYETSSARRLHATFRTPRTLARSLGWWALLSLAVACTKSSSDGRAESAPRATAVARLSLGATRAEALRGDVSTFAFESTPDLALHADLPKPLEQGTQVLIQGTDPLGVVVWSYPHVQRGASFDAVLPVFGSAAARNHAPGEYLIQVLGPGHAVVASGVATFTSTRGG
jgi:hypothetical protein